MALLTCPDCGNQVSSKAAKCPRCGCPMSVMIQEQPNSEKQQNTEQQNIEESTQEQLQSTEIVNNEEKIIEEQPKVSVQKEEKVVEPAIRQKSAKEKTNNIIVAVAIIILFGIIIVAGRMSENNEKESSYVPSDNTNSETTSVYNPNVAKIQNPEEATQRLNDFKRKITSSPFEKDAVEIEEIIDNDYAKYIIFRSKLLYYNVTIGDELGGEDNYTYETGSLCLYDAKYDNLYEFKDDKFSKTDFAQLPHKKIDDITDKNQYGGIAAPEYGIKEFDIDIISSLYQKKGYNLGKNIFLYPPKVTDFTDKGFLVLISSTLHKKLMIKLNISNNTAKIIGIESGEIVIYDDKYIVIPNIGDDGYKVIDLYTENEIENPFWTPGSYSLYDKDYKFDLTVFNNGKVTGKCVMKGYEYSLDDTYDYNVIGNVVIRLSPLFFIQKKDNHFFLYETKTLEERYGSEAMENAIYEGTATIEGYTDYEYSFFDHKAENINPSDIKKTTELFMK